MQEVAAVRYSVQEAAEIWWQRAGDSCGRAACRKQLR